VCRPKAKKQPPIKRKYVPLPGAIDTKFHDIRGDEMGICHQILQKAVMSARGMLLSAPTATNQPWRTWCFFLWDWRTEMASVWSLGTVLNVEVPDTIKVVADGNCPQACIPRI
jgi:hypothetical protein